MNSSAIRSEGPSKPGDNPNVLNAKPRGNVRPRVKNSSNGTSQSMRLGWIDPLPQVDVIYPLGLEPNPESIPAGEIDLDFDLPETIGKPFSNVVNSVGDKIMLGDDEKVACTDAINALSHFKAARQLYSTMLDHEKAANQPLKAVYYDETPIPVHLAGALGIVGHMKTKLGDVLVRDAGVLFKRWIARGLQLATPSIYKGSPRNLIWSDQDSFRCIQRLAKEQIAELVKLTYNINLNGGGNLTVSMPQLIDQDLSVYYDQISTRVPSHDALRHCVSALQSTWEQYRDDVDLPNGHNRHDILQTLGLTFADGHYAIPFMRDGFEEFIVNYITDIKWRVESIFKVGPPPAGTTGYGAQTVQYRAGNAASWQYPISDADVNLGYLFSPAKAFSLFPRLVGYARRGREAASAAFAQQDARAFTS